MKNILILSSSPRNGGNSDLLCDEFMKGAISAGHSVQKIRIAEKNIHHCTGCGVCNTAHKCVLKDDMADILDKMVAVDVIVMATPVYFYTMNGVMKNLIDRVVPRYTELSNKDFYLIVAAADSNKKMMQRTIDGFLALTEDCLDNAPVKGIVYGVGTWQIGDVKNTPAMQEAYQMGENIK